MTSVTPEVDSASPPAPAVVHTSARVISRTWLRKILTGGQIMETCPSFCRDNHQSDDIGALDDLQHGAEFEGPELAVFGVENGTAEWPVLAGRINVDPYNEDSKRRVPHVNLNVFKDEVMECLSPDELAAVIATVRAHCDGLEKVHAQLVQARAECH
ncbi:DUF6907 domain-containing protein [Streptomyces sp. NPDC056921]|uniref:DUF6907 domain-containing protein n=1 Tax=Streptomyces sp. NPDC056921 TaxID=3345966 RepID=UPI00363E41B5